MAMNHSHAGTLLLGIAVSVLAACGSGAPGSRDFNPGASGANALAGTAGRGGSGSATNPGSSGTAFLDTGSHSGTTGTGSDQGSVGTGLGGGTDGSGASTGAGSNEEGSGEGGGGFGGSSEEGASGDGTLDVGKTGVGGTIDVSVGVGGTLDTGVGGSLDTGVGGSLDTGTGGTIDTCIPSCTPDLLGVGEKAVNLVVFEDAKASGCDTEGRMWVGGNAELDGYGVGAQLKTCDATDPVLVVGGNLDVSGGVNGAIWVGGEFAGGRPKCGAILSDKPGPVDFAFVEAQLNAYSRLLATYPVNGTTSTNFSTLTFTGTDKEMNIFTVDGEELAMASSMAIDVPVTSTVIVNVTGTTAGFSGGTAKLPDGVTCGSGAVRLNDFCNQLIWNMPTVKTVTVSGTAVQGTILAPQAALEGGGANVNGTVIVNTLAMEGCVEMHPHYFNGCLCTEGVNSKYACCPK